MEQEQQEGIVRPANLGQALRRGFGDIYDRLGLVVGGSFIWFIAITLPIMTGILLSARISPLFFWIGLLAAFLIGIPVTTGVFVMARNIVAREDPSLADLKSGFSELLVPAMKLAVVDLIITGVLVADLAFFFGIIAPIGGAPSPILVVIGVLFLYLLFMWFLTTLYHLPELVWRRPPTFTILKRGFLLVIDNLFFTIGLLFVIILLSSLCVLTGIGLAILFMGAAAILTTSCLRELFIKYGIVEEPPEVSEELGWPKS